MSHLSGRIESFGAPILATLEACGIPPEEMLAIGGAVMALEGIRAAGDLDLVVHPDIFETMDKDRVTPNGRVPLLQRFGQGTAWRLVGGTSDIPLKLDINTFHGEGGGVSFLELWNRAEETSGYRHVSLSDVKATKLKKLRPTDLRDVLLISKHQLVSKIRTY